MGIFDNLLDRLGYARKTQDLSGAPQHFLDMAGAQRWNMPDYSLARNQAELYQRLSWVYAAVAHVSRYAATQRLSVYRLKGERKIDIPNHAFEKLIAHPNPSQSRFDLLEATFSFLRLTGNCYWWLNQRSEGSEPLEIWIMPPYRVNPIPDGKMYIAGYTYQDDNGMEQELPLSSVVHFKSFHPTSEFVGLGAVEPVATVSAGDLGQQKWSAKLYGKNNGRLPGILGFGDYIQDPAWKDIKDSLRAASDNRDYLLLRGMGKGGVELIATPTPKDMEALATRNFTKEEIYNVFAPGLASVLAVNATEANAKTGKATLIDFAVWPAMVSVSEKLTNDVIPLYGPHLTCEFDDIRATDRALELAEQDKYAMTHTINEIREEYYEDDPLPDERGDLLPAQVGQSTGAAPTAQPEPEPTAPGQPEPETTDQPEPEEPEAPEPENDAPDEEAVMSEAVKADIDRWRRKALNSLRKGEPAAVEFESDKIPGDMFGKISSALKTCQDEAQVKAAFAVEPEPVKAHPAWVTDVIATIQAGIKALDNAGA